MCKPPSAVKCKQIKCDPSRGQCKSRQYKIKWIIWLYSSLIKGRWAHNLSLPHRKAQCPHLIYLCDASLAPQFTDTCYSTAYTASTLPSDRLHLNTCCLSSEEATDWGSVGAEYIDLFPSIYIFHKSEYSFNFLSRWKKKLHWTHMTWKNEINF